MLFHVNCIWLCLSICHYFYNYLIIKHTYCEKFDFEGNFGYLVEVKIVSKLLLTKKSPRITLYFSNQRLRLNYGNHAFWSKFQYIIYNFFHFPLGIIANKFQNALLLPIPEPDICCNHIFCWEGIHNTSSFHNKRVWSNFHGI